MKVIRIISIAILYLIIYPISGQSQQINLHDTSSNKKTDFIVDSISSYVNGLFKKIDDDHRYVSALGSEELGMLPLALIREINGKVYAIAIDSATVRADKGAF